jgi:alpha-D-xyloside xylohydrolase
MFAKQDNRLVFSYDADKLWIEPWGKNALRIRATQLNQMPSENWALEESSGHDAVVEIGEKSSSLTNGEIKAVVSAKGKLTVYGHGGKIILDEAVRNRRDVLDPKCSAIDREAREFQAIPATNDYHIVWRLESLDKDEKIYGMGQYQQPYLDLKGLDLELAHRNSQASVPFAVSSLGYGLLWNNPGIGRAVFGKNIMSFEALSSTVLDCWLVAGETPAEIVQAYAGVTGTVPMMPEVSETSHQCRLIV